MKNNNIRIRQPLTVITNFDEPIIIANQQNGNGTIARLNLNIQIRRDIAFMDVDRWIKICAISMGFLLMYPFLYLDRMYSTNSTNKYTQIYLFVSLICHSTILIAFVFILLFSDIDDIHKMGETPNINIYTRIWCKLIFLYKRWMKIWAFVGLLLCLSFTTTYEEAVYIIVSSVLRLIMNMIK